MPKYSASIKLILICFLLCNISLNIDAQVDSSVQIHSDTSFVNINNEPHEPDDEFNIFLLSLAVAFVAAMFGCAIIGAFLATLFILLIFIFTAVGIISSFF